MAENVQMCIRDRGSLGQGILTGKYSRESRFGANDRRSREVYVNFHGEKLERNLRIVEVLRRISEAHGRSVAACAIRWILDTPVSYTHLKELYLHVRDVPETG